jgi:peptidoglycan/xylan/chitin deacetylase (PgdA/CDA1 family)
VIDDSVYYDESIKKVCLTFDDGPSEHTDEILDILAEYDVKATFFVTGHEGMEDRYRRIACEGHTLGMHSWSHDYTELYADVDAFAKDFEKLHSYLYDVTGVDTKYYRFPGGSSNQVSKVPMSECIDYLDDMGYVYFDWNAMNDDAEVSYLSADELNSRALGYIRSNPGDSVLLLHDLETHQGTVDALPGLLDTLIAEGYSIAAIDDDTPIIHHFDAE